MGPRFVKKKTKFAFSALCFYVQNESIFFFFCIIEWFINNLVLKKTKAKKLEFFFDKTKVMTEGVARKHFFLWILYL